MSRPVRKEDVVDFLSHCLSAQEADGYQMFESKGYGSTPTSPVVKAGVQWTTSRHTLTLNVGGEMFVVTVTKPRRG